MKKVKKLAGYAIMTGLVFAGLIVAAPTPSMAVPTHSATMTQPPSTGPAARWVINLSTQIAGAAFDTIGQVPRGIIAATKKTRNPILILEGGFRYGMSIPEQYAARIESLGHLDAQVGFNETSWWAERAADNKVYTYAKAGAVTGGLLAAVYGPFAATTTVQTFAATTAAGAIGGAGTGHIIDMIAIK